MKGSSDEDDLSFITDGINVKGVIDKFVSVFVDRACSDTGISADNSKSLLRKVTDLVSMQVGFTPQFPYPMVGIH